MFAVLTVEDGSQIGIDAETVLDFRSRQAPSPVGTEVAYYRHLGVNATEHGQYELAVVRVRESVENVAMMLNHQIEALQRAGRK